MTTPPDISLAIAHEQRRQQELIGALLQNAQQPMALTSGVVPVAAGQPVAIVPTYAIVPQVAVAPPVNPGATVVQLPGPLPHSAVPSTSAYYFPQPLSVASQAAYANPLPQPAAPAALPPPPMTVIETRQPSFFPQPSPLLTAPALAPRAQLPSPLGPTAAASAFAATPFAPNDQSSTTKETVPPQKATKEQEETCKRLLELGHRRRSLQTVYTDVLELPSIQSLPSIDTEWHAYFPYRLHCALLMAEREGWTHVFGFCEHGRAFDIRNREAFVQIVQQYNFFNITLFASFQRQLKLWGFGQVRRGKDMGCYYHDLFLMGYPELCQFMKRSGFQQPSQDSDKTNYYTPDFGKLPPALKRKE